MKIIQISDVHIRNLKYHDEYRRVFDNLYRKIDELKPDLVINTGDTAHTKTQISPEFVEMTSDHIKEIEKRCPYLLILGNHDLNLMNTDRQDAISPIVENIKSSNVKLQKRSGLFQWDKFPGLNFWIFSLADYKNYPVQKDWRDLSEINIGLFHGSVATCITDSNWRMTHVEYDLSMFDGLDYVLMGDIHKQQFFNERKIGYAGSLIQQNFGEELDKGFLLWNIKSKTEHEVHSFNLTGSRKFYTIRLNVDGTLPEIDIEPGARIRLSPSSQITLSEQNEVEKLVRTKYQPHDVITLSSTNIGVQQAALGKKKIDIENIRHVSVQEKLIRDFFSKRKVSDIVMQKILDMNRKYQLDVDQRDDTTRNVMWKVNKIIWSNFFNFGSNNFIDFTSLSGLTGIFGPNASGKSNVIDVILETIFDATTRGINKNIYLINDNKNQASAIADITANEENFLVERSIDRIKYGQRKEELKEWGKTSVTFSHVDDAGDLQPLVGQGRPETERNIRHKVGTFDDFMLTSLSAQWNQLDVVACKETERKKIFFRFLDLDIFEEKRLLANEDWKTFRKKLETIDDDDLEDKIQEKKEKLQNKNEIFEQKTLKIKELEEKNRETESEILEFTQTIVPEIKTDFEEGRWEDQQLQFGSDIHGLKHQLMISEEKIRKMDGEMPPDLKIDVEEYEKYEKQYDELVKEIQKNDVICGTRRSLYESYKKDAQLLNEVPCGDKYPGCRFLVEAYEKKKKIDVEFINVRRLEAFMQDLKQQAEVLSEKVNTLRSYERREELLLKRETSRISLENIQMKLASKCNQLEAHNKKFEDYKKNLEVIENNVELDKKIDELKKTKMSREKILDETREQLLSVSKEIGSITANIEAMTTDLASIKDLRDQCSAFELYTMAMGKDGIAYNILTQKLPLINEEINKVLSVGADFKIQIEHDHEEQSIRFFLQYGQYKPRLLELGSGAEKFLGSIAIRTALLNISNLPKTNMFVIDEGFGKLDPKNMENVQRMFDYLRTVFEHVIVISHLDVMKDMVDNIIEITTDQEGYAHIEVGT